jgi:hypothetical protein
MICILLQFVLVGLLGVFVVAVTASISIQSTQLELFSYDSSNTEWDSAAVLQNLLNAPKMEANDFAHKVRMYDKAADKYSAVMAQAEKDESDAEQIATRDKQELTTLRSLSKTQDDASGDADINFNPASSSDSESDADLKDKLSGLDSKLQSLSLASALHPRALSAFSNTRYTDDLRFHSAVNQQDGWGIRQDLNAARVAAKRADEANVIANNEMAIADAQARRVARLQARQAAARNVAAAVEAHMRGAADSRRAAKAGAYDSAMRGFTGKLQGYVAQDMDTLGRLKHVEDSAAFGPHVASGLFRQAPTPAGLPDVDPATFMGNAPFRDADSLADYKAAPGSTTELSEQPPAGGADSISRVMRQERRQLARLTKMAAGGAAAALASPTDDSDAAGLAPTQALNEQPLSGDAAGPAAAAGQSFTSFPTGEKAADGALGDRDVEALDDGALIRDARPAVGVVRIPLGAHEVRAAAPPKELGASHALLSSALALLGGQPV